MTKSTLKLDINCLDLLSQVGISTTIILTHVIRCVKDSNSMGFKKDTYICICFSLWYNFKLKILISKIYFVYDIKHTLSHKKFRLFICYDP